MGAKSSQRRFFAPNFALFFKISNNGRNFDVEPSQRRYFAAIWRQKKIAQKERRRIPRGIHVEFTRIFCSHSDFFAQFLVHFLLGMDHNSVSPTDMVFKSTKSCLLEFQEEELHHIRAERRGHFNLESRQKKKEPKNRTFHRIGRKEQNQSYYQCQCRTKKTCLFRGLFLA